MGIIYAFTGTHASGKSTIGKAMEENGFVYYKETAQILIDRGEAPWLQGSGISGPEFQARIFDLEIRREQEILERLSEKPAIVESYHLGNIAHCDLQGAEEIARRTRVHLGMLVRQHEIRGVHFKVDPDKIPERTRQYPNGMSSEQIAFYARLCPTIIGIYREFDIPFQVIDTNMSIAETIEATLMVLEAKRSA